MLVMALLFELTFFMQILSETGVKVTFEFGLTVIPVPVIDMFLWPMKILADVVPVLTYEFLGLS